MRFDMTTLTRSLIALGLLALGAGCRALPMVDDIPATKPVSTAPASIQLTMSSRTDQRLDLHADVLTVAGVPVPGVSVTFTVSSGTVTPATATTDANGRAVAIASAPTQNTVTATSGNLSDTIKLLGPPAPQPDPLTVSIPTLGTVRAGEEQQFGVNVTSAAGSTVRVVEWTFGDGGRTTANDPHPRHTYGADGTYTVTVSIADDLGRTANASQRITVSTPAPIPPAPPTSSISVTLVCTVQTPTRRSCIATPTLNGTVIAASLVSTMTINWGDGASDAATSAVAIVHTYALGTVGNFTVRVTGSLVSGETFDQSFTIAVG